MVYDGSGKLAPAIAELYGISPKSQARIADLIKQAKEVLGITSKAKHLPIDVKLAIYQWHYDRLNPVQIVKQDNQSVPVQDVKQDAPLISTSEDDSIVYDVKQTEPISDNVQNVKQADTVYDFKQIHFAIAFEQHGKPKRTTVMLEGYLVKALQRKHTLADNTAIRLWIEQAIKGDSVRFDSFAPLTRQVKRLIIESL